MIRLQNLSSSILLDKSSKHPGTTSEPEVIGVVLDPVYEEKKNLLDSQNNEDKFRRNSSRISTM